jgi:nicotinate-nucleotide adenylyltransferase
MLHLTLEHNPAFELSRVDIDRPGPHYSVDMLDIISGQFPGDELFFLMGSDSLRDLPRWRTPHRLVEQAVLAVMHRPGIQVDLDRLTDVIPGLMDRLVYVDSPLIEIAADDIRARVARGRSIRYLLPDPVQDYILQQGLYDL